MTELQRYLEGAINHAIVHGAQIQERGLGTILPTRAGLAAADRHADAIAERDAELAARTLPQCTPRTVGGERRYYATSNLYATVRNGRTRWFETRADGRDYAARAPLVS
jgi:hypothetical protein